jgi:AbrB family looped-hinge helix DNA binding protein
LPRKSEEDISRQAAAKGNSCCQVESIVAVDGRGQMVLPKDVRDKAGIHSGDKLALISWRREEKTCCILLIKAENLADLTRSFLGPMVEELTSK